MLRNLHYDFDDVLSSSDEESCYSDKVDSDIEAELYGLIHHETSSYVEDDKSFMSDIVDNYPYANFGNIEMPDSGMGSGSPSTKRKSDLISGVLENIKVDVNDVDCISNKKQKICTDIETRNSEISSTGKQKIEVLSEASDSEDSVLLVSEPDESEQRKLQFNIEEMLVVSSDSDSSKSENLSLKIPTAENNTSSADTLKVERTPPKNLPKISGIVTPNHIKSKENGAVNHSNEKKDPWYVNTEDLYRSQKTRGRYHEKAVLICSNCNQKGHLSKQCTEQKIVKCFLCCRIHSGVACKNRICTQCFEFGHDRRRCRKHKVDSCSLCNMIGHSQKDCPDLWRRYHLTVKYTRKKKLVKGAKLFQDSTIYCCNCGYSGHFGSECKRRRSNWPHPTCPSVVSYEDSNQTRQDQWQNQNFDHGDQQRHNQRLPGSSQEWPKQRSETLTTQSSRCTRKKIALLRKQLNLDAPSIPQANNGPSTSANGLLAFQKMKRARNKRKNRKKSKQYMNSQFVKASRKYNLRELV